MQIGISGTIQDAVFCIFKALSLLISDTSPVTVVWKAAFPLLGAEFLLH